MLVQLFPAVTLLLLIRAASSPSLSVSQKNDDDYYDLCKPFSCGGNITFSFPFSTASSFGSGPRDCGLPGYQITCDPSSSAALLQLSGRFYRVLSLFSASQLDGQNFLTVADDLLIDELRSSSSCRSLRNLSLPAAADETLAALPPLELPSFGLTLNLFECSPHRVGPTPNGTLTGLNCSEGFEVYLSSSVDATTPGTPAGCQLVAVPVSSASLFRYGLIDGSGGAGRRTVLSDRMGLLNESQAQRRAVLSGVLSDGFPLQWPTTPACDSCTTKGGRCGYDSSSRAIACFCRGGCRPKPKHINWKLIGGVVAGSCALFLAVMLVILKYKRKIYPIFRKFCLWKTQAALDEGKAKQFMKDYRSSILTCYSYNEIKRMVNRFENKLGEGGYGSVYKGKLPDGRAIAVKILDKSSDVCQDFINEVTTIGTIHHVNVIRLLGFCWDDSKQALIYEFMPNGSLGDMLSRKLEHPFGLSGLLEIALGVAHGIEYLHYGCNSRILHLDIKPQNVLLDHEFNPKISDFGLAKMYSRNRSIVSMTGARGTIGFIAPEVFLRSFGNPSEKSDVYSYGMLLLEMIGVRRQDEPSMRASGESTFPDQIYEKLTEENIRLRDAVVGEEEAIARKMVMVGLWCIQMNPRDRPSMGKVVDMLSGNVEAIAMPPKPFLFSPPRVQSGNESGSTESSGSFYSFPPSQRRHMNAI